jgi:hypothetical protein
MYFHNCSAIYVFFALSEQSESGFHFTQHLTDVYYMLFVMFELKVMTTSCECAG